jgi:hypothetical protein
MAQTPEVLFRPSGALETSAPNPAINRWAIIGCPCGTKNGRDSRGARPSSGAAMSRLSRLLELSDPILSSIRSISSLALPPKAPRPSPAAASSAYSSTVENTRAAALRTFQRPRRVRAEERGMAVVVMLILMAILMLFVASNVRTLVQLKQEIRLAERKQIHRLEADGRTHANSNPTNAITQNTIAVAPESANAQAASK